MKLVKERNYSGQLSGAVTSRETASRAVARKAAADGIVLLKNNGVLPLSNEQPLALYGAGARFTMKGGTGSGDVNERERVTIYDGLVAGGFTISSEAWLDEFDDVYRKSRIAWRDAILERQKRTGEMFFFAYSETPYHVPCGRPVDDADLDGKTTTAVFVLSRIAGEGADRQAAKGDYCMSDEEEALLASICARYEQVIVLLNAGGPMDLSFTERYPIAAVLQISQLGMEGGNAVCDVLSGKVNPSAKLTDTWANCYDDYPSAATFSHCNGNVKTEKYEEGIYVGYRYFDTFGIRPRYPFGFGLSYTTFAISADHLTVQTGDHPSVSVDVTVQNTGSIAGREVAQVYVSCPQGKLDKEYQRLCGFAKTPLLAPQQSCTMTITFPVYQLASFSEEDSGWLLEQGDYIVRVGNSSANTAPCGTVRLNVDHLMVQTRPICPLQQELTELMPSEVPQTAAVEPIVLLEAEALTTELCRYREETTLTDDEAGNFVKTLTREQKIQLIAGDPSRSQDNPSIGNMGKAVPGAAGETSACASMEPWNLPPIVTADGPAGLRLTQQYEVAKDGGVIQQDFTAGFENGFFNVNGTIKGEHTYHQYCTAFPIGTALAQSWDTALIEEVGKAVAVEMEEFGVTLWLAPGMNLHRNPLCGRNFEYYSEDPLLTGMMAAAMTLGVQSGKGVGTTIKHYCCNNQEDNRMGSDSVLSERALRELYLRGFEIAVKTAQPMSLMTSYNLINGIHAANCDDTINKVLRDEWGFEGFVMTDWGTTSHNDLQEGGSSAAICIKTGNDLVMPGTPDDHASVRNALEGHGDCTLTEAELDQACRNIVNIVYQSLAYEGAKPYRDSFDLQPFFTVTIH